MYFIWYSFNSDSNVIGYYSLNDFADLGIKTMKIIQTKNNKKLGKFKYEFRSNPTKKKFCAIRSKAYAHITKNSTKVVKKLMGITKRCIDNIIFSNVFQSIKIIWHKKKNVLIILNLHQRSKN